MNNTISQAVARPARTLTQLTASAVVTEFVDAFLHDMTDRQYASLLGLLTLVFGYAQVLVEDHIGKGFLRKPQPPEQPVEVVENVTPETNV